jgi:mono/diheme cytochrome c family protein
MAAANVALTDPVVAKGKGIFEQRSCNACHGDGGVGTAAAPALIGAGANLPTGSNNPTHETASLKQASALLPFVHANVVEASRQEKSCLLVERNHRELPATESRTDRD